ncbi:MAG: Holliday junction DNA helicase RuvA [Helicobacteraceae bacterium CG2_30_36_10]|nr:MAG: Holliday junction DNA helicase RuvA [Helicobacteraceae bacterium CG2_30_36_10]
MIVGLKGNVISKEPTFVHVEVSGVVYEVFISLQTFSALPKEEVNLFTSHIIREDAQLLYGFVDMSEKKMFERLIKINGVGPKVAMAICSTYSPFQFASAINNKDMKAIQKVPGIGPRSAGRILVELNGFDVEMLSSGTPENKAYNEASEALESLGFTKAKISKALSACQGSDTASLVKESLRLLQTI